MQEVVQIQKRNGFNVLIVEGVSFFFSTSQENVERFILIAEKLEQTLESIQLKYEKPLIKVTNKLKDKPELDSELFSEKIRLEVAFAREVYDMVLGVGVFDELYTKIREVEFWTMNLEAICNSISLGIEKDFKIREKKANNTRNKYLSKKKKKRNRRY